MAKINILGFDIANLIAAGEVVDRPSSVVKELCENALDSGAKNITVEIRRGGTSYIRVSDDGCGIDADDLPLAVLRHATSKIAKAEDLASIYTLGFRGEALAAIAAVSKMTIMSKPADAEYGSVMECVGGEVQSLLETGCAKGTGVIVRELFFNVPARRKFLKKDATETAAVSAVMEKIALSSPSISIKYLADGEMRFHTSGDGDLKNTIFSVYGRDVARRILRVDRTDANNIRVHGYVSEPDMLRSNRNSENFFINGRFVKSKTAMASLEQAYSTRIPHEKFPFAVLNIELNPAVVDVNVHPSKLEVKFANERIIFEAIYYAVLSALETGTARPQLTITPEKKVLESKVEAREVKKEEPKPRSEFFVSGEKARQVISAFVPVETKPETRPSKTQLKIEEVSSPQAVRPVPAPVVTPVRAETAPQIKPEPVKTAPTPAAEPEKAEETEVKEEIPPYEIIGEVYNCYVIVQLEDRVLMVDKHAAHERILFDELCKRMKAKTKDSQILMIPMSIFLSEDELIAIEEYSEQISSLGFVFRVDKTRKKVSVSEIPTELTRDSAEEMIAELGHRLSEGTGSVEATEAKYFEAKLYQASCKAAIKGGRVYSKEHLKWICDRLFKKPGEDGAVIKTCPHGRPVAFEIKKSSIERQFNRIQ